MQDVVFFYEGYVRLTVGWFSGSVQPAEVRLGLGPNFIAFETHGYWNIDIHCPGEGVIIPGGDGSVSAYCRGAPWLFKFWAKGLYLGSPATLMFDLHNVRGLWSGVLMYAIA